LQVLGRDCRVLEADWEEPAPGWQFSVTGRPTSPGVLIPWLGRPAQDRWVTARRHLVRLGCRMQPRRAPVPTPGPQIGPQDCCVRPPVA